MTLSNLHAAFLALALAGAAAPAMAQSLIPLRDAVPSIAVTGEAGAEVVPDLAILTFAVVSEKKTPAEASAENAAATQAVMADVKAAGVEPRDVRTLGLSLSPVYDETIDPQGRRTGRKLRGYEARNEIRVRLRHVEQAGELAQRWIAKGANEFSGVEFDVDQRETRLDALRGEAMRDARRKAQAYVDGLGLKLGRVLSIAPGGAPRPMPMAAARMAKADEAGAAIPLEPGVERLSVQVEVVWEIAQ